MVQLAGSIGLGNPDALGADVVVAAVVGRENRISAGEQEAGVRLAVDRQK
mgnify:CR=1 FL=1